MLSSYLSMMAMQLLRHYRHVASLWASLLLFQSSPYHISSVPSHLPADRMAGRAGASSSSGSLDNVIAERGSGKSIKLERNNTMKVDDIGELNRGSADCLHVFTADYTCYALPKHQ